jgi:hypothetical protein
MNETEYLDILTQMSHLFEHHMNPEIRSDQTVRGKTRPTCRHCGTCPDALLEAARQAFADSRKKAWRQGRRDMWRQLVESPDIEYISNMLLILTHRKEALDKGEA